MASSKEPLPADIKDEASADCLWTNLPEEIKQEILKALFSNQTVTFFGPWWNYIAKDEHYHMEYVMNRLAGHILPKLFMISKTVFNKSEHKLNESQKDIMKRVCIYDSDLMVPDLKDKIGRHKFDLYTDFFSSCVPDYLLKKTKWELKEPQQEGQEAYEYFELDDASKLNQMLPTDTQTRMTNCFGLWKWPDSPIAPLSELGLVVYAAYKQGTEITVRTRLRLWTENTEFFVNDSEYKAIFSTKDWVLGASNGTIDLELPQTVMKKRFDEYVHVEED